jgi:PAT family beta-lactamase induction signal transducer AmpG
MFLAFQALRNLPLLATLLFASNLATTLFLGAQSGWLGGLVQDQAKSRLAAWSTVGNIGGGGVFAMLAIPLLRSAPSPLGALILAALIIAPVAPLAFIPAPAPDKRLSSESWRAFLLDLRRLVAQPRVLQLIVLFVSPAAAFALAYTLGGLGAQFKASERFVGLIGGGGVLLAGAFGSLAVPPLAARVPPRRLYLLIGACGAAFTLALIALPRTPATFGVAMVGENMFQSAAFTTMFTIAFRALGENNPLAATQMSLMTAASTLPIVYMQVLDGHAYGVSGLAGAYVFDGGVSLLACAALFFLLVRRSQERGQDAQV